MDAMDALKARMQQLLEQRQSIESEVHERSQRLNAPGQPGMDGPLVDKEGFPRADVDVHAIRLDRNAVIRLANDHKQVTQEMEQLLHQLHAFASSGQSSSTTTTAQLPALRPFAVVDEVTDDSPAQQAGVRLGDQLCRFGSAVAGSGEELQQVAQELQAHEGQQVPVVFLRHGQQVDLQLVPRRWEGRGLLGCHLRPL
eukprot:gene4864-5109_t